MELKFLGINIPNNLVMFILIYFVSTVVRFDEEASTDISCNPEL